MDKLLMEIIAREGVKDTDNPNDSGGRTKYGISQKFHPEAWLNGPPTLEEAKEIYFEEYIVKPNFHLISPDYLMAQLVDFAVHSGPMSAIKVFQRIIATYDDGVIGPATLKALSLRRPEEVHQQLVSERTLYLARIVQRRPKDLEFLYGWIRRALSFLR